MSKTSASEHGSLHPCHCQLCHGALRNRRTIRRHYSNVDPYPPRAVHINVIEDRVPLYNNEDCDDDNIATIDDQDQDDCSEVNIPLINENLQDHEQRLEDESNGNETDNVSKEDLERAILRILEAKVKNGWSRSETLKEIRNIYELFKNERIPHQSWNAVLQFLRKLGYKDPQNFKVCIGKNHVTLVEYEQNCSNCEKPWNKCTDYFVLGLQPENYFLNEPTIKDHLEHWLNKHEWMDENSNKCYKEVWHGERFKELSYFWDENVETFLPVCCPNCDTIISVEDMENLVFPNSTLHDRLYLSCPECTFDFVHEPKKMRGNPLNQAFIFHEDGFNAFEKKSRGISAIHISSACISKEKRLNGQYMRVYSFIPSVLLPEGVPHKMDAFLEPLINEVKKLYIEGINVKIEQQISIKDVIIHPGEYTVRTLLLLGTADLKGHQEIVLHCGGGKVGCRRCVTHGVYIPVKRHYYYGHFGVRYRSPSAPKTVQYLMQHGKEVDNAMTLRERKRIQTDTGVSGVSILCRLYALYRFDPVQDMVIDRMHLTFNMLKRELIDQIWVDMGENVGRSVNCRDPTGGGLIDRDDFSSALAVVNWPKEEKASGVARVTSLTDKMGGWKSNDFKKFSSVAREVFAEKIPSRAYDCYMLLCQAVQMLYSKELRTRGWLDENISRLDKLLWAHAIRAEEYYGIGFCTENLEYSTHATSDIKRHSSMDNYSCELYERAILRHKKQKHNSKGLEKTFADREAIRDFLEYYKRKNGAISSYDNGKSKYEFNFEDVTNETPFYFKERSFTSAEELLHVATEHRNEKVKHAVKQGVVLGKVEKLAQEDTTVIADIRRYCFARFGVNNLDDIYVLEDVKSVVCFDQFGEIMKISKLDTVKIDSNNMAEEYIIEIQQIILVGPFVGCFYTFVNGKYYIPAFQNGQVALHQWTKTTKFIPHIYTRDSVQPMSSVKRKVIMYPEPGNQDNPSYFLCIDFKNPEVVHPIHVPIYPEVGDTVKIKGTGSQVWYAKVNRVDLQEMKATVQWFKETKRRGIWIQSDDEAEVSFRTVIGLATTPRGFGGYTITDM